MTMKSNKVPYVVAGSVIGGAAAFLLFTDSGRRMRTSIRNMDANCIPNKIGEFREMLDRRTQDVNRKIDALKGRVSGSVEAGRRAFGESGETAEYKLRRLEEQNGRVVASVHRSIDELNRTLYTFERSVLNPLYQAMALIRGVRTSVGSLKSGKRERSFGEQYDPVKPMFDKERINAF